MAPRVSVIIPVRDDAERLRACLAALSAQTLPRDAFEVVVVDNGSRDPGPLREAAEAFGAILLQEPRPGSYAARNKGLAAARGSILAFTDSDALPVPTWLEAGERRLREDPSYGLVAGAIDLFPLDERRLTTAEIFELADGFPQERYVRGQHFGVTANLFVRRAVFDSVGPFSDKVQSGGDREFGRRAHEAGHRVAFEPGAVVRHPARRTMEELVKKARRTQRGVADLGLAPVPERFPARWWLRSFGPPVSQIPDMARVARSHGWGHAVRLHAARWRVRVARNAEMVRIQRERRRKR